MPTDYVTRARNSRVTPRARRPTARATAASCRRHFHPSRARARVRIRRATTRATVDRARGTPTVVDRAREANGDAMTIESDEAEPPVPARGGDISTGVPRVASRASRGRRGGVVGIDTRKTRGGGT